jgi:GDPmannose 4,6-dehydratase
LSAIDHIYKDRHETSVKLILHYGDICNATNLIGLITKIQPIAIYNLAAMSHVRVSFDCPGYTADCDGVGVLRTLDAIRMSGLEQPQVSFYSSLTQRVNSMAKCKKFPNPKRHPFI